MKTEKEIRKEIFAKVKELYSLRRNKDKFVPGKRYINYAGRVYDEKEIINFFNIAQNLRVIILKIFIDVELSSKWFFIIYHQQFL